MPPQNRNQTVRTMGPGRGPHARMGMPIEKPKNTAKTLKRLIIYIGKEKNLLFFLLFIMLLITSLTLLAPSLQGNAMDIIAYGSSGQIDFYSLIKILIVLAFTYALNSVLTYFQGILSAKVSQSTVYKLRNNFFKKIEYLPIKKLDTSPHGDLMSRMTNDIDNVSNSVSQSIASFFSSILTVLGTFIIMLIKSPPLTIVALFTIPLSLVATLGIGKVMRSVFSKQQKYLGNLNSHIEETVNGFKTVLAYGKEKDSIKEFSEISAQLKSAGIKAQMFGGMMGPIMNVISNLNYLLIAGFGGYLCYKNLISIGVIQAFLIYSKQFTRPINELANQYAQIQSAIAGAERVFEVMDTEAEVNNGDILLNDIHGKIEFKDVVFSYKENEPVLTGINFSVNSGEKVAIVGATGSGKTTIINLLTRFYDIDHGSILLDGIPIESIEKGSLRNNIAIVLQDTVLFSGTIADNIRYGSLDADIDSIKHAAKTAYCDNFIEQLPDSYNTVLKDEGSNLSQGQRQLISIARAVLKNPKILILDEATSNVDTRTEMHIQNAMIRLMENKTSLIIAHRLSTIRNADRIIVIDNGNVVEVGSHEELLNIKGYYFNLYNSQFSGIET